MTIYSSLRNLMNSAEPARGPHVPARGARTETELRRDAENILRSAVSAADPARLVAETLARDYAALPTEGRIHVAGFGVAAAAMACGVCSALGDRVTGGVLLVPAGTESDAPECFDTFGGGLPVPDQGGEAGARAIRQLAREIGEDETLLALVSGGGAGLLTVPPDGLHLEDLRELVRLLLDAGATEPEIETVQRHVDQVKGGRLAAEAAPSRSIAVLLSDVVGDAPELVACGPFAPERSRVTDATAILERYGVWDDLAPAVRGHLDRLRCGELPGSPVAGDSCFDRVTHLVAGNGRTAARAACAAAERLGYEAQLLTDTLTGEARQAGEFLAATARSLSQARGEGQPPLCVVTAGATRATAEGSSRSGPNQELVLGAVPEIAALGPILVASMDTRGSDAHGNAAGALATGSTARRAMEAGSYCREALESGEAARLFEALDDSIVSGPTGTDVGDIQLLLLA
jgi:glycerate-2-kinase